MLEYGLMKLFLLTVKPEFDGGYDTFDSMVIRAADEAAARLLANEKAGDEIWLDSFKVDCAELLPDGEAKVVLGSFNAG